jgi:hypothetical protein
MGGLEGGARGRVGLSSELGQGTSQSIGGRRYGTWQQDILRWAGLEEQIAEGRIRSIGIGRQHTTQPHCNSMKRHDDSMNPASMLMPCDS